MQGLEDISRGSLSKQAVEFYTEALTRHYGEPVRPVSAYCDAFRAWARCLVARKQRVEAMPDDDPYKKQEMASELTGFAEIASRIELAIDKSNLLARMIYCGQPVRTRQCPRHKGRWSGWSFSSDSCECQDGPDLTGWLPEKA